MDLIAAVLEKAQAAIAKGDTQSLEEAIEAIGWARILVQSEIGKTQARVCSLLDEEDGATLGR
jgi:hypothetical protein